MKTKRELVGANLWELVTSRKVTPNPISDPWQNKPGVMDAIIIPYWMILIKLDSTIQVPDMSNMRTRL